MINTLHGISLKKPGKALQKVKNAIEKYPNLPQLYNYLTVCYYGLDDEENAIETVKITMELFPDYLFGRVSYAEYLLSRGRYKEIPAIFNDKYDLKTLYPQRDVFHYSEVLAFFSIMAQYFYQCRDFERCRMFMKGMVELDPDDYRTVYTFKRVAASLIKNE